MSTQTESVISSIVRYLVDTHRAELGIPRGKEVAYIAEKARMARNTVRSILGNKGGVPARGTRAALARFFSESVPGIDESWFLAPSLEEFRLRASCTPRSQMTVLPIPQIAPERARELERTLSGTYIVYRHSISGDSNRIARSVLHIQRSDDERFVFRMSATDLRLTHGPWQMHGIVIPAHNHLHLIGKSNPSDNTGPIRVTFITLSDNHLSDDSARIGMIMTSRSDSSIVAAKLIIIKVKLEPNDPDEFALRNTRIEDFARTIQEDFGSDASSHVRYFLDNRPIGSPKDSDLRAIEGARLQPDSVVRAEVERFCDEIPAILKQASARAEV